jgi:hypothetical protein
VLTRGRFLLFVQRNAFSTGGYSAEYGGAFSVLFLNTEDSRIKTKPKSLMTVGLGLGKYSKWNKS